MNPASDLNQIIHELPGNLPREVRNELIRGFHAEAVWALNDQKEIAQANAAFGDRKMIEGLGEVTMSLNPTVYHFWGQQEGYECWRDKKFREDFRKRHPEVRVKSRSAKVGISLAGVGL